MILASISHYFSTTVPFMYFVFIFSNKIFYQILAWFFKDCLYFFNPCQLFVWRSKQYKANWRKHAYAHCICGDNTPGTHELTRKLYVYKSCGTVGSTNKAQSLVCFFALYHVICRTNKIFKEWLKLGTFLENKVFQESQSQVDNLENLI